MTANIKLLPLPELASERAFGAKWDDFDMQDYARANVAHATAAKDAEIERLRAEREVIGAEAAKYAGKSGRLEAKVDRLAESLRVLLGDAVRRGMPEDDHSATEAQVALRDHDQEDKNDGQG